MCVSWKVDVIGLCGLWQIRAGQAGGAVQSERVDESRISRATGQISQREGGVGAQVSAATGGQKRARSRRLPRRSAATEPREHVPSHRQEETGWTATGNLT